MQAELSQREAALQDANEKLKELDRLKSQFVSNVSHELRTPLTNIKTYLWLLEKGKPEKHVQYMATLNRETELLHYLIEDLLQLSRLDLGQAQPVFAPVDLNQLVTTLVGDRAVLFAERGLALCADIEPELPLIQGDARMLTQVLTNLMTNAMNYTPRGGTVTVRTAAHDADGQRWLTVSVQDTGHGIPEEEQRRLFERFFRGEVARRSGVSGTGLGLAICQEIVQRHAGRITVESRVGEGSTFTVWLS